MTAPQFRVLIDWDNDGYFNVDTTKDNIVNLIPDSPYCNFPSLNPDSQTVGVFEYGIKYDTIIFNELKQTIHYGGTNDYATTPYQSTNYPIKPTPNTAHTFSLYARNDGTAKKLVVRLYAVVFGTSTINLIDTYTFDNLQTNWTRYHFTYTSPNYVHGFFLEIDGYYDDGGTGVLPTGSQTATVSITGLSLTQSNILYPYNASTQLQGYDNITEDVINLSFRAGKQDFLTPISYEGDCEIVLNNTSKKYSPENENSPLSGFFRQDLPIKIEFYHPTDGVWYPLWRGVTAEYQIDPSTTLERRARIIGKQGIYKLRNTKVGAKTYTQKDLKEMVLDLLENLNLRVLNYPMQAIIDFSKLDVNAYVSGVEELFSAIDNTTVPMFFVGDDWDVDTTIAQALESILQAASAHLWINENGNFTLRNITYFYDLQTNYDAVINLDTDVQDAQYRWGQDIINRVIVSVKPKKEASDTVVWETQVPVYVGKKKSKATSIIIDPRFEESRKRTILSIKESKSDAEFTFYKNTKPFGKLVEPVSSELQSELYNALDFYVEKTGDNKYVIRLVNNHPTMTYYVDIKLKGDYVEGGDREQFIFENTKAIEKINNVYERAFSNDLFSTYEEAEFFANNILNFFSEPRGEFNELTIVNNADKLRDFVLGYRLLISESQTDETQIPHVILGINGTIDNAHNITIKYDLFRTTTKNTYVLDADSCRVELEKNLFWDWGNSFINREYDGDYDVIAYKNQYGSHYLQLHGTTAIYGLKDITGWISVPDLSPDTTFVYKGEYTSASFSLTKVPTSEPELESNYKFVYDLLENDVDAQPYMLVDLSNPTAFVDDLPSAKPYFKVLKEYNSTKYYYYFQNKCKALFTHVTYDKRPFIWSIGATAFTTSLGVSSWTTFENNYDPRKYGIITPPIITANVHRQTSFTDIKFEIADLKYKVYEKELGLINYARNPYYEPVSPYEKSNKAYLIIYANHPEGEPDSDWYLSVPEGAGKTITVTSDIQKYWHYFERTDFSYDILYTISLYPTAVILPITTATIEQLTPNTNINIYSIIVMPDYDATGGPSIEPDTSDYDSFFNIDYMKGIL